MACRVASSAGVSAKKRVPSVNVPIIASGGVTDIKDIDALLSEETQVHGGITGVITGRAIYEGTLDLAEAISRCR